MQEAGMDMGRPMKTRVLVVDDDAAMRALIRRLLQGVGEAEAVVAVDGVQALSLIDQGSFDAIILDWHMPKISGLDLLRIVRARGSRVPVLMLTVEAQAERVREAILAGASDYVVKPFDHELLKQKLKNLCQKGKHLAAAAIYRARNVMNADVITVAPDTTVGNTMDTLLRHGISGLPVLDAGGQLVGIVTEFQLVQAIFDPEINRHPVRDLMTSDVVTVKEDTPLSDVANIMVEHRIRRIPVLRNGKVVGIIARRDLVRYVREHEEVLCEFLRTCKSVQGHGEEDKALGAETECAELEASAHDP